MIETGAVTLGKDVFVGEMTVLDIETSMGDGAQLGHSSSLHTGQAVPEGEHWHGSPARRTEVDYRGVEPAKCGALRRIGYPILQLLSVLVYVPLALSGVVILLAEVPQLAALLESKPLAFTSATFYRDALAGSAVLFFGSLFVGLILVTTVPRVLNLALTPDKVYRLYGFHYWVQRAIARRTNVEFFMLLFGDSSYVVNYLRWLGYDLSQVEQTGSNFGTGVKHDNPYLSTVGSGTMVADGLSFINAEFSSTSFRVSRVSIGPRSFLGNNIAYPSRGKTGENCLLGTKVMVPLDGEVREGVGLLGSPSFEIPRSVERDSNLELESGDERRSRLGAKNRHNLVTMGLFLLVRWVNFFAVTLLAASAIGLYQSLGAASVVLFSVVGLLFSAVYWVLVARSVSGLQALRPQGCSIYDRTFWRHERYWKVPAVSHLPVFNGTPFKSVIWRLMGVRIGRRVFDDGCFLAERTFVTIGDDCTLNAGSVIQCHSQEDGAFKSDRSTIGTGVTLGVGAFVHYGVSVGDGAVLAPDSFVMKGEEIPPRARWAGNPARDEHAEGRGIKPDRIAISVIVTPGLAALVRNGLKAGDGAVLESDSLATTGEKVAALDRLQGTPSRPAAQAVEPDLAMAHQNLVQLVHRSAMLESKLDGYAREAARAGRRGAAVALLAAACVLVLTAGTAVGSGIAPGTWRSIVGVGAASSAPATPRAGAAGAATDAEAAPGEAAPANAIQVDFISDFFALLPGDVPAAFAQLSPNFQRQVGGLPGFTRLYRDIASVRILGDPVAVDGDTVSATLRFQRKGAVVTNERYEYTLTTAANGRMLLAGWTRLP